MKARGGRRDAPGKVLKDRRSPRQRGRTGTSVRRTRLLLVREDDRARLGHLREARREERVRARRARARGGGRAARSRRRRRVAGARVSRRETHQRLRLLRLHERDVEVVARRLRGGGLQDREALVQRRRGRDWRGVEGRTRGREGDGGGVRGRTGRDGTDRSINRSIDRKKNFRRVPYTGSHTTPIAW